ncbi:MAG: alpha/beta hydrolase [Lachnospiraceae bacterium]|nr:alpha/beta hydrolase [Lachnospiraceae bacterium]
MKSENKKTLKIVLGVIFGLVSAAFGFLVTLALFLYKMAFSRDLPKVVERYQERQNADAADRGEDPDEIRHEELRAETVQWVINQEPADVYIRSYDGLKLYARLIQAEEETKKTAILVHGFRARPEGDFAGIIQFYHEIGWNVLMVSDRAHGNSEGNTLGFSWLDRRDIIDWARQIILLFGEDSEIVLHGVSMGAGAVMMASGEVSLPKQVKGIIEDCGFSSTLEEFRHVFPEKFKSVSGPVLAIDNIISKMHSGYFLSEASSVKQLNLNTRPALFIHGGADDFVPTEMVYDNYYATKGPRTLYICDGAGHARSFTHDPETYKETVKAFLETL